MRPYPIGNGTVSPRVPKEFAALMDALQLEGSNTDALLALDDAEWLRLLEFCDLSHLALALSQVDLAKAPEWVRSRLNRNVCDNARRFEQVREAYIEAAAALRHAGVPHVVLKGVTQCPDYVCEPRLRLQSDIDLFCPQQQIETALIELSGSNQLNIGVELGFSSIPQTAYGGFGVTAFGLSTFQDTNGDGVPDVRLPNGANGTPPQGITAGILHGKDFSLPVLVQALQTRLDTNVLNVPSVLVNNNGSAKVVSKDQQPTTTITALGASAQTQQTFGQYVDAGITMQISPTISASRYLRLKITLEVSNFLGTVSGAIPPPKTDRTIDTTVNVPDGDTMVIGGIIVDNKSKTHNGVPILGDIPILGYLFRAQEDSLNKTTLYFFVTPHILRDRDFADLAELSYRKKLDAASAIGTDRIQVIDPTFGRSKTGVDMNGFEVPLYRSPQHGEVDSSSVGLDAARVHALLKDSENAPKPAQPDGQKPAPQQTPPDQQKPPQPNDTQGGDQKPPPPADPSQSVPPKEPKSP